MVEKRPAVPRPGSLAAAALLFAAAAVTVWRGGRLARGGDPLDATGERRFFAWAWREPAVPAALERIAPSLRYGETVCLQDLSGRRDPAWLRAMALYALPRQIVLVPADASKARAAPACRRTALLLAPDGSLALERTKRVGAP